MGIKDPSHDTMQESLMNIVLVSQTGEVKYQYRRNGIGAANKHTDRKTNLLAKCTNEMKPPPFPKKVCGNNSKRSLDLQASSFQRLELHRIAGELQTRELSPQEIGKYKPIP